MNPDMSWWDQALCAQIGDDQLWFPEKGGRNTTAKTMCHRCPVQTQCLAYAMTQTDLYGVWGGLGALERYRAGAPYTRYGQSLMHARAAS